MYCGKKVWKCKVTFLDISQKWVIKHWMFWPQKHATHYDEQSEWSHDRVLINSKFHFLLENKMLPHFFQMIDKYSTLSSQKDSTCYYKWFRIATLHVYTTYTKLHHYNIITLWKIVKIQNFTIQVHTFQPSKIRSSYLQRTAETYSFSCVISHMASCY